MPGAAPNIFPALSYRDADAALRWLVEAFDFREHFVARGPDGEVVHAELGYGPGTIMLGNAQPAKGWISPLDLPAVSQSIYVAVDDPDAHHDRARAAGAEIVRAPNDTEYGSREYGARDLEGHLWSFGTYRPGGASS